jgi:3-oxoacid CoA-transferase subunit B
MKSGLTRDLIAMRAARELHDGDIVNLGIGLPTRVSSFIAENSEVILHCENGLMGYGRIAHEHEIDPELVNAGSEPVTLKPGASFSGSSEAFAMIRGGHVNIAVLGAYQVSEKGDLANWLQPNRKTGSVGGSMDLVCGSKKVIITMEHTTRDGKPRIVKRCTSPLTGKHCVNLIVTNLAVIEVKPNVLMLREIAHGFSIEEIQEVTEPRLLIAPDLHDIEL